jgi:hypothetical protein
MCIVSTANDLRRNRADDNYDSPYLRNCMKSEVVWVFAILLTLQIPT